MYDGGKVRDSGCARLAGGEGKSRKKVEVKEGAEARLETQKMINGKERRWEPG